MKRPILMAALLAASSAMIQPAQAQDEHTGSMLRMFDISTPSAGKVNFIGTGTANFNHSIGTNNNFNVGSSTALGVNASASSTEDYTAEGNADLQLAGTSRLQQTIGTATSAFNVATANESSSTAAHTSAFEVANSQYEHGFSWTEDYSSNLQSEGDGSSERQTIKTLPKVKVGTPIVQPRERQTSSPQQTPPKQMIGKISQEQNGSLVGIPSTTKRTRRAMSQLFQLPAQKL